jgi:hypothetical protein
MKRIIFIITFIFLFLPLKVFSFYLDDLGNKALLKNDFDPQAAIFAAYSSADVYSDSMIKLFLSMRGFKDIQFLEDKSTNMQAIVAYKKIEDKKVILISFRGTQELKDWLTDIDIKEATFLDTDTQVHNGFYQSFKAFIEKEEDIKIDNTTLADILSNNKNYRFFISGHSLGGAIATLYGAYLYDKNINDFIVYTFGAPGIGYDNFVNKYDGKFKLYRIRNRTDPIPYSAYLAKFKHIGQMIVFDNIGNNVTNNYETPDKLDLVFGLGQHSIVKYIEHLKIAYFKELLKNKIAPCNSLKVKYDGLFYCNEENNIFYPYVLDAYNEAGASSISNALFHNDEREIDELLKDTDKKIDFEKKALESLILIDSTGFFKDDDFLDILYGEDFTDISKIKDIKNAKLATKYTINTLKTIVLFSALKEMDNITENDIKYIIRKFNLDNYERTNFKLSYFLRPIKNKDKVKNFIKTVIADIKMKFSEKFPQLKKLDEKIDSISRSAFNSIEKLSSNISISNNKYQSIFEYFSNYLENHKDEIKPFSAYKNFTSATINVLGILAAPIIEYAKYEQNNIQRKKIFLNILKPYISQKSFEDIYNKLETLEKDSISAIYEAYYISLDNIKSINGLKTLYDTAAAASDFVKGIQLFKIKMPGWINTLGKLSDSIIFKAAGVFFNQYDLLKNENDYKDLLGAAAISSSLSRYFLKGKNSVNKIVADLLMINSQKLFNASRYWTGSYNDIEKLSGKVGAFLDIGGSILSEGYLSLIHI